jgi:hypothetical protein
MSNFVREYIEIADHISLDEAIEALSAVRRSLPEGAVAELRMRGDDVFGRHLSVCYMRPKAMDELSCEIPYRLGDDASLAA